ncbi:echinoderm microtubule-associated protein-like 2 isoform X2 [Daphnia pulex]|uniref:echinoderm microtubule-associated protein-like 2 isoform X2 n=1 Tax=Daphnia pulex TaxID=6669 RepID=UPI001EDCB9EC|nr:echinoderm microtubule-associated protein-like 2 isoform X2 [Daphnia pulex]
MENDMDPSERLDYLEKRLDDQNNEIVCLRSTLADALRRLSAIESQRGISPVKESARSVQSASLLADCNNSPSSSQPSRDVSRRLVSSASTPNVQNRNSGMNQSNGSLVSESPSSNSGSPAPSPSPTSRQQHVQFNSLISEVGNGRNKTSSFSMKPSFMSTPNSLRTAKRWSSTSDFIPSNALVSRRPDSNSLLNLNVKNPVGNMQKYGARDAFYSSDEGIVKFVFKGRNLNFYIPTSLREKYSVTFSLSVPEKKLKMEWVYGYRGKDCRSNLYLIPTGEIVYFIAAVVVLFNVDEHGQRFYLGHTGEIKCLTVHPNKLLIASGQSGGREYHEGFPHVRIWNSVSLQTLFVLGQGDFGKSVSSVAFSKADGGNLLMVIDDSTDHILSLWEWQKGERGVKIAETRCSSDLVVAVEWNPIPRERFAFVTSGKGHICFWSLENGLLSRKLGIFESRDKPKYVTCLAFADNGDCISGDSNGCLIIWLKGSNIVQKTLRNAHEGPIFCLLTLKDGRIVSGGGKDGQLVLWDFPSYRRTGYITEIPEKYGNVRIAVQGKGTQILVGTTRNAILRGSFDLPFKPLMIGHTEESTGLCVHPSQSQFVSYGYDGRIQLWDTMSRTLIWEKDIENAVTSACFSPEGSVLVLATTSGKWFVMDSETRDMYAQHTDGNEPIQVVKFSPNGKSLAIGSKDASVYIYQVLDRYRKYCRTGRCVGHSSFISQMDWSCDNVHLQTNSGDNELFYWNTGVCRQITLVPSIRDVEWNSVTCPVSPTSLGILSEGIDGADVYSCCASNSRQLMCAGDNKGRLKLYRYPSQPKSPCHSYQGHSNISNVCFLSDDTRVLSAGGRDSSVIQWTVEN